jgi:protoporphyrinogen/coproporphyrinogen III oxidase
LTDVVIIGAGIAGLAAAWELRARGIAPLVLERSDRAGGVIVTERSDGFVIDGGPDSLLVQKPAAIDLCAELGLRDRLIPTLPPRTAFVLRGGRLLPLPEGSYLGLPTRVWPFVRTPLFTWRGKLRMATEIARPRMSSVDESIDGFIRRRFGSEAADYLAEPLLAGIHAGDAAQLSVAALFPRLPELEAAHGSVVRGLARALPRQRSAGGAFMSLRSGLGELPEAIVNALGPGVIRYNSAVAHVSGPGPYQVALENGTSIEARRLIVATPAWEAARLLRPLDGRLAALCDAIPYASTATVVCAFDRQQVGHPLEGTGFVVPRRERHVLTAATWVSSKWPERAPAGRVLLRGFVGGMTNPDVLAHDDEALASTAIAELSSLLGIEGQSMFVRVYRWPHATPQYVVGHTARVREIDERLEKLTHLFLVGSGYRGTGIPDCIGDARRTAARLASSLQ